MRDAQNSKVTQRFATVMGALTRPGELSTSSMVADGVKTLVVLTLLVMLQMIKMPQYITGTLVNMGLILTAATAGPIYGVFVGVATPVTALAMGILPTPLAGMVPFIGIANALFVGGYAVVGRRYPVLGVALGTVVKVALLMTAVKAFVTVPPPVAVMMQWPQAYTAVSGGLLAIGILAGLQARKRGA